MSNKSKILTIIPLVALCLCGCNTTTEEVETSESSETSDSKEEIIYDSAYALVGDFTDSSWDQSPAEDSQYYLAYSSLDSSTKYWEATVTIGPTAQTWNAGLRVVDYGGWSLVAGYESLNPASTGVIGNDDEHNIKVTWGESYKITIDLRSTYSILVTQLDENGEEILPNYDSAYTLYGDFEEGSWETSPSQDSILYLAYDSTISTSKYWSVTVSTIESTDSWDASFRVIQYGDYDVTIANYNNLDGSNSTGVTGTNNDNNICLYWGTAYDIIIDCRGTTPTIIVNYQGEYSGSSSTVDDAKYEQIEGFGRIDSIANNDDYIMGVDISSIIEVENAGGKFYDYDGNEVDLITFLASQGVNYVRIRLWNDPYVEVGNPESGSFQGGGNDLDTDLKIAARCVQENMKICLDFHYSDFWADPSKQTRPRAWDNLSTSQVIEKAVSWTTEVLEAFAEVGATPSMVQVGNETNNNNICSMSGNNAISFMKACNEAIKTFDSSIKTVIHYAHTGGGYSSLNGYYKNLVNGGVDFDVIGLSYYPYYHINLQSSIASFANDSVLGDKEICVMEYSYGWTTESPNWKAEYGSVNNIFGSDQVATAGYPASVQGQAQVIYDINKIVADNPNGIGTFYWEPAWLARENSSWASEAAHDYLEAQGDAGGEGACTWANQALFDYDGNALQSLKIFDTMKNGEEIEETITSVQLEFSGSIESNTTNRSSLLPESTTVVTNLGSYTCYITWNSDDLSALENASAGSTVVVHGTITFNGQTYDVSATYTIISHNYIQNSSFESGSTNQQAVSDYWTFTGTGGRVRNDGNARTGNFYFNPWYQTEYTCGVSQVVSDLPMGTYTLEYYYRSDNGQDLDLTLYAEANGTRLAEQVSNGGDDAYTWLYSSLTFAISATSDVTIGLSVHGINSAWGHVDDFALYATN